VLDRVREELLRAAQEGLGPGRVDPAARAADLEVDAGAFDVGHELAQTGLEVRTGLLAEPSDRDPELGEGAVDELPRAGEPVDRPGEVPLGGLERQVEGDELLAQAVVKLPSDAEPLAPAAHPGEELVGIPKLRVGSGEAESRRLFLPHEVGHQEGEELEAAAEDGDDEPRSRRVRGDEDQAEEDRLGDDPRERRAEGKETGGLPGGEDEKEPAGEAPPPARHEEDGSGLREEDDDPGPAGPAVDPLAAREEEGEATEKVSGRPREEAGDGHRPFPVKALGQHRPADRAPHEERETPHPSVQLRPVRHAPRIGPRGAAGSAGSHGSRSATSGTRAARVGSTGSFIREGDT
jgi:hypothetical protein